MVLTACTQTRAEEVVLEWMLGRFLRYLFIQFLFLDCSDNSSFESYRISDKYRMLMLAFKNHLYWNGDYQEDER
jgi:hypothetical protein